MPMWLFKEEPDHYSFADLQRDGKTIWDGVTNAQARNYLRQVRPGDRALFYHTGKEKAIVGEMTVIGEPGADSASDDPKSVVVEVEAVRALDRPVSLAEIKDVPAGVKLRLFAWHDSGWVSAGRFEGEPIQIEAGKVLERQFLMKDD